MTSDNNGPNTPHGFETSPSMFLLIVAVLVASLVLEVMIISQG
jgi:hypothetical protein